MKKRGADRLKKEKRRVQKKIGRELGGEKFSVRKRSSSRT